MQRDLADQREAFAALGVRMALKSLERLIDVLKNPKCTCSEVAREMAEIESRIRDELGAVSLFAIPDARASYFNQGELFGHEVFKAFPSADNDILEVGNCLALERGTAAVMHLMRVVEVGLRALRMRRAEALRITGLHTFAR